MTGQIFTKSQIPSLKRIGFAVEYHPAFQNSQKNMHGVDVVLLSFIARGEGTHILQDRAFPESAGQLSITHYDQQHCIQTRDMDVFNIFLDPQHHPLPELPNALNTVLSQIVPLHPNFYHGPNDVMRIPINDTSGMVGLLHAIIDETQHPDVGHDETMRLYMNLFLIRLCREAQPQLAAQAKRRNSPPMEKLRLYLDQSYKSTHTLAQLAQRVNMHPNSLCRAFKHHTGMALMDYLTQRRLQAAMLDLRNGSKKILHVALDAGFQDISRFNRIFKQHVGVTPRQYRLQFKV